MIDWTKIILTVVGALGLFAIGYLIPVKSPFDHDCPEIIPVSTTTVQDSVSTDPLPVSITDTELDITPTIGWQNVSITQDTIDGKPVDIIEKEKTWTYVDTLVHEDSGYVITSMPEIIISGLVYDTIRVDIFQNIQVDPKPYYIPVDTVYILTKVVVPAEPEPLTVWESPIFWGVVGIIFGGLLSGVVNKNNIQVTSDFNDLTGRD